MAAPPAAETVGALLAAAATRAAALGAHEARAPPLEPALALAAAPALAELLTASASDVEATAYQRAGLLLARLYDEASGDPSVVHAAAFGDGRLAAFLQR